MQINVQSNIKDIQRELLIFEDGVRRKATVSSLNRTVDAMQSAAAGEVQKIYTNLKLSKLKRGYFRLQKARSGDLTVKLLPRGGRLPLTFFSTLQWKAVGGGVSVVMGRENVFIPHAFIARRGSKRDAVFLRTPDFHGSLYNKGTFRSQRMRVGGSDLPIAELFARSIPEVILRNRIDQTIVSFGVTRFNKEFEHQLQFWSDRLRARTS